MNLTINEAATLAGKSSRTIRRAIKKGQLAAKLVKGKYRVTKADLAALYELDLEESNQAPDMTLTSQSHDALEAPDMTLTSHDMTLTSQSVDMIEGLIEALKAELRAKDEQLRAKDDQIAQLMQTLQGQQLIIMELTKQLPALESPPTPAPPAPTSLTPEPKPEPTPARQGFWATVRKRFRRE